MEIIEIFKNIDGLDGVEIFQTLFLLVLAVLLSFSKDIFKWIKESAQKNKDMRLVSSTSEATILKDTIVELEIKLKGFSIFQQRVWVIERALNQSKNAMKRNFRALPNVTEEDIEKMGLVLYKSFTEANPFMRDLLIRNHFVEMTEYEFAKYLDTRPMTIIEFVSEQIDEAYTKVDISIPRGVVRTANQAIVAECICYIKDALTECRRIEQPIGVAPSDCINGGL